ncbi:hypothetical protein LSAT2_026048 [Lamellibrachia satsuma]|nr:hypothetical protein LSAT2_026048 [Lamellibrachia satsuma]
MHLSFQTTVTLLLFCYVCLMERTTTSVVGATKVTRTLYVTKRTGATLTRERRQTPEKCTDNIQTRTNTYTRQATRANEPTSDSACSDWCLTNVRCAAAYWLPSSDRCLYTTDPTHRTRGLNGATYYKIILRCPKHYACKDRPCQRGTCTSSPDFPPKLHPQTSSPRYPPQNSSLRLPPQTSSQDFLPRLPPPDFLPTLPSQIPQDFISSLPPTDFLPTLPQNKKRKSL